MILVGTVLADHAMAQGVVNFGTSFLGPGARWRVFDVDGTTPVSGRNFIAQLLYQNNSGTWVAHPATATFFDSSRADLAGYWFGGARTLENAGGVPSPADPTRAIPVNLQVRVWDGGFGAVAVTFDQAMAGGMKWGTSAVFVYREEYDLGTDDTWMKTFQGFSLVPEPSVWALFALGMGWLVWRGRKRRMNDES